MKFKLLKYLTLLPIVAPIALPLVSCNQTQEQVTLYFRQAIKGGETTVVDSVKVNVNTKWKDVKTRPDVHPYAEYEFMYWTCNGDKLTDDTVITSDMFITPRFGLKQVPTTVNPSLKECVVWLFNQETKNYFQSEAKLPIYTFNNSHIGYMQIEYFASLTGQYVAQTNETTHTTVIVNAKYPDELGGVCKVDYANQTITFYEYEKFIDANLYGPMTSGLNGGKEYFRDNVTTLNYKHGVSRVIDFKKYGIEIYECKDPTDNKYKGYMPYELFKVLFGWAIALASPYNGRFFDYNGAGFYEVVEGTGALACEAKAKAKAAATSATLDFYNSEYMEYCYNLFAFTLDFRLGIVDRIRRNNNEYVKFLEHGAYHALKDYHDDFVSIKDDVSNDAIRAIFKKHLDDGGHSGYVNDNVFTTLPVSSNDQLYGEELLWKLNLSSTMRKYREEAGITSSRKVIDGYKEYTKPDSTDKIAYVTFDSFDSESGFVEGETTREMPETTNETNYMNDTLRLTMYANKMIQADKQNIKDVVVDLSCNGGGSAMACMFIASWICGGVTEKIYNPHTNDYVEFQCKADVNGDGNFDENDHISADVNLYVITSSMSFSCGNLLPTNIQDCRPNKTTFIGTRSGGGSCYVDQNVLMGMGTMCQFSSSIHILRQQSVYGNFIDNEDGCTITSGWEINELTNPADFFNREALNKKIWNI